MIAGRHAVIRVAIIFALTACSNGESKGSDAAPREASFEAPRTDPAPEAPPPFPTLPHSRSPDLDFGSPPLGTKIPRSALPAGAATEEFCALEGACGYRDAAGIDLDIGQDYLERKCIRIDGAAHATLPFGLRPDDSPESALRRLRDQFDAPFERVELSPTARGEPRGVLVSTAGMLTNELGWEYEFHLLYAPDGSLREICARTESVFD